jgi:hypothetical protein
VQKEAFFISPAQIEIWRFYIVQAMGADAFSVAPLLPANMRSASRLNTAVCLRMSM